ncbi:MAG: T9SS type B sorting domain-containing protein [Bacteroidetes bacterium]|nr:T9SS type B sorting domain-containing protein [Bacteroidota bacterium]
MLNVKCNESCKLLVLKKMKISVLFLFLLITLCCSSQTICNQNGNLAIFSNYDGGIVTIDVDQNIPNLIIAICTYEPVQVTITGAFAGNVVQVIYAGYNSTQNNNNCGQGNFLTSITGVPASITSILTTPPVGYTPAHGNGAGPWGGIMIGASQCDTLTNTGGVNTPDEIVYYFENATNSNLYFHNTQYACWQNSTYTISRGGNCCIGPPSLPVECDLAASVSIIPNSVCEPCFYNGPPILINELMISPNNGDGSISGPGPTGGRGEWIELYNPDLCDSADISCYYLGNSTNEGSGGFRLPSGTVIPPNGFCLIRGIAAPPVPSNLLVQNGGNVVEIVVPGEIYETGVCCTGTRVWFPNAGGWFAFYDAIGNPVDAVRWGPGNVNTLAGSPCISTQSGCSNAASLLSYNDIPDVLKYYASSAEGGTHYGQTIRRLPDGGNWSGVGTETYATCNDPNNCLTGTSIGFCNGTGTVNVTSGTAPFTYQWDDDLSQTTQTATNLCEGTYNVIVTDANNCQETYTIQILTNPFDLTTTIQQPGCLQSNGSISINPFDASYTYSWSPNVSSTNSASNLPQGTYQITITQFNCTYDTTIVLQNPVPFETFIQVQQTICGENNGAINISNTPNSSNYSYTWTPAVSTSSNAINLAPGSYQLNISDNTCAFDTSIIILPSNGLTSTATVYNATCLQANGAIDIDVFPSTGTYNFTWPSGVFPLVDSAANLSAGSYLISFTDGICTGDTTIIVTTSTPPTDITTNITSTQCDQNTGEVEIVGTTGGSAPYTYSINNGVYSNIQVFDDLSQGNYTIAVLDANNCAYQEQVSVPVFAGPSLIQVSITNPNCGLSNGALSINGTIGGTGPYQYTVDGAPILPQTSLQDIEIGTYNLSVVDANGCSHNQIEELVMTTGEYVIRIPNVLTANSDETNDLWTIYTECIEGLRCEIFNRWGNKIFEFDELTEGWNGKTMNGMEAVSGVYFYKVTFDLFGDEERDEVYQGHITLIR